MLLLVFVAAFLLALIGEIALTGFTLASQANEFFAGLDLLTSADSCLQQGALNYLRTPTYSGESLQINSVSCTIHLTELDSDRQEITCTCRQDQRSKIITTEVTNTQGVFTFSAFSEK